MTDRPNLVLYGDTFWISPYVFSTFVALCEKELPFEVRPVALHQKEHHEPGFRSRTVTARVPVLEDGDFSLAESMAIIDYLEERYPPPGSPAILPGSIRERARARQLLSWIRSDLWALREDRPTARMFYATAAHPPLSEKGRADAERLVRVAGSLLAEGREFLFGAFCVADADLAFALMRLVVASDEVVPPRLRAWAESIWQRPSVRDYVVRERPPLAE